MAQPVVFAPQRPGFYEQIAPTLIGLLGNFGLQKMSQGFKAGQVKGERIFEQKQAEDFFNRQKELKQMELDADIEKAVLAENRKERGEIRKAILGGKTETGSLKGGQAGPPKPSEFWSPFGGTVKPKGPKTPEELGAEEYFKKKGELEAKSEFPSLSATSEYAPDMQTFINQESGDTMVVNTRDPNAVKYAGSHGFSAPSPEDRGYGQAIGVASAKAEADINESSAKARTTIQTLGTMDQLLDRFRSSKIAPPLKTLQSWANAFGLPVDVSNLGAKEAFDALANQLALQSRNLGKGMVLAGQMSDKDLQFLQNMNPQLMISKGGNKLIIQVRKRLAQRQNEIAKLMRQYKKEHKGRFDATDFDGYVESKLSQTSIFGIPDDSIYMGDDSETGLPIYKTPSGKYIIPEF